MLIIVLAGLIGAGAWATQYEGSSTTTRFTSTAQSVAFTVSSTGGGVFTTTSSAITVLSLQPIDFNNVSYVGCVWKDSASGHTYVRVNVTLTNSLNATVDYRNVSIVFAATEVSNGFQASESYTQLVSGPVNAVVLSIPIELPIDNVVSGSFSVEVFIIGAHNQVEAIRLAPSISVAPSDYQQCSS